MIDAATETYPDIVRMLQTWKSKVTQQQEELVFFNFSELYTIMKRDDHITEEVYDRLGFVKDTDYASNDVDKPDEISQEMRHRAKVISHNLQCQLRDRRALSGIIAKKKSIDNGRIKQNSLHKTHDEALVKIFIKNDDETANEENNYGCLPINAFSKCNVNMLKAFIHVRLFESATIPKERLRQLPRKKVASKRQRM